MTTLFELLFLALIAAGILWFGKNRGFFNWRPESDWNPHIRFYQVAMGFAIYFAMSVIAALAYKPLLAPYFQPDTVIGYITWLNLALSGTVFLALLIFWLCLPKDVRNNLWRSPTAKQPYFYDLRIGFFAWLLAMPAVIVINETVETLLAALGFPQLTDQLAVQFVKMTAAYPLYFSLAMFAVIILAPLIEEFLFRALLQSFIRKHLGPKQAILITALCFSCFHFALEQGVGNVAILASLFPLALFLGFVYERQRSLAASMSLHSFFNLFSILNLYFMGGIPCA